MSGYEANELVFDVYQKLAESGHLGSSEGRVETVTSVVEVILPDGTMDVRVSSTSEKITGILGALSAGLAITNEYVSSSQRHQD